MQGAARLEDVEEECLLATVPDRAPHRVVDVAQQERKRHGEEAHSPHSGKDRPACFRHDSLCRETAAERVEHGGRTGRSKLYKGPARAKLSH
eukprot:3873678-Pleurochrysis_carterae.AAC.1